MKKIYIMVMLLMMSIMVEAQTSVWNGSRRLWTRGEGTKNAPYLIESAEQLAFLSYAVNKGIAMNELYFKLTTDIDLNGSEDLPWIPIGLGDRWFSDDGCERFIDPSYSPIYFSGHFDGDGHSIYNLYVGGGEFVGLFGLVAGTSSSIENVSIENGYVNGNNSGGIIGKCTGYDTNITNCHNNAEIIGLEAAGGIIGYGGGVIRYCSNTGSITSSATAGGIAGFQAKEIAECFNTGAVTINGQTGGGIIGRKVSGTINIRNCYNIGSISGNASYGIGGIAGVLLGNGNDIRNCYNVGNVSNEGENIGALFGNNVDGIVENIYYLNTCGGWGTGMDKTAEEMRDPTFVDLLNNETNVWSYDNDNINDGYPILGGDPLSSAETTTATMAVYPNPAKSNFTVEGTGLLTVTNVLGQKVLEISIEETLVVTLPEGIYLLTLTNGDTASTRKIIIY